MFRQFWRPPTPWRSDQRWSFTQWISFTAQFLDSGSTPATAKPTTTASFLAPLWWKSSSGRSTISSFRRQRCRCFTGDVTTYGGSVLCCFRPTDSWPAKCPCTDADYTSKPECGRRSWTTPFATKPLATLRDNNALTVIMVCTWKMHCLSIQPILPHLFPLYLPVAMAKTAAFTLANNFYSSGIRLPLF